MILTLRAMYLKEEEERTEEDCEELKLVYGTESPIFLLLRMRIGSVDDDKGREIENGLEGDTFIITIQK